MTTYGYARVSTVDQCADRQITALQASGVEREFIFVDRRSGKDFARPAWRRLRRRLRKGDLIVVQSIDRLGRDYGEVQEEWRWITKTIGADVQVLDMPMLDTRRHKDLLGTFIADLVLQVLAYCAQFEREAILTRQRQGIDEAKKRGVRFGRPRCEMPPEFTEAVDDVLRSLGGVTLLRVAMELRGISCHEERDYEADPDSISCSRSFGKPATTKEALAESLASFTAQAAAKLRRHGLLAAGCNVYAQIFAEGGGGDCVGRTVVYPAPTDATNKILRAISDEVKYFYLPGVRYRKTGIVFFGLEKPGTAHQLDLFADVSTPAPRQSALYKAVDALNAKYGKGKVFFASEGIGKSHGT